jgi:hypothetical protein
MNKPPPLTQLEFTPADHEIAERIAKKLGYKQTPYTSTSALWGLFCIKESPEHVPQGPHRGGCIIKTKELGFLFVSDLEDLNIYDIKQTREKK